MSLGKKIISHSKRIYKTWSDSNGGTYGAAVAYYTVFSLAPLLVIAISITSLFVSKIAAQASIISQFKSTFGANGALLIENLIQSKPSTQTSITLVVIGFIVLIIGANGVFAQMQKALDAIFKDLPEKTTRGLPAKIWHKVLSFGLVLSVGFLLLVSLALSALITAISGYLSNIFPNVDIFYHIIESVISLAITSFFFGLIYKVLPSKRLDWKPALIGGVIVSILFTFSKYLLGTYLGYSLLFTTYGAASTLVLLILWAYYMSQVFFFGAIILRLYLMPNLNSS